MGLGAFTIIKLGDPGLAEAVVYSRQVSRRIIDFILNRLIYS